jgi:hypothetical protein
MSIRSHEYIGNAKNEKSEDDFVMVVGYRFSDETIRVLLPKSPLHWKEELIDDIRMALTSTLAFYRNEENKN